MAGTFLKNQGTLNALLSQWFPDSPLDKRTRFVIVCDIGQGNCNVVFDRAGLPIVYYDLGGGVSKNSHTYPDPAPKFCFLASTRYILSHWDEDHYHSMNVLMHGGERFHNAPWLVPNQEAYDVDVDNPATIKWKQPIMRGPAGDGLLTDLAQFADVHLWPDERPGHGVINDSVANHYRVIKVQGTDRNNHALAFRITNPGVANEYILLTGDATYQAGTFVHNADQRCVGLVASHHGSEVHTPAEVPRPKPGTQSLIAYSFGWGNEYGHPHMAAGVPAYEGRGWDDERRMDTGGAEAAARYAGPRGNIGLIWPADPKGPGVVQHPAGALEINQAAIALIATAVAEIDTHQPTLAQRGAIAAAAARQAAIEVRAPLVAAAMAVPAILIPAQTLVQVATAQGTVHASLNTALLAAPAAAAAAAAVNTVALANAVVDAVLLGSAVADKTIRAWTVEMVKEYVDEYKKADSKGREPGLPEQAKYTVDNALNFAGMTATADEIKTALPDRFVNAINLAARAIDVNGAPASLDDIRTDIAAAILRVSLESIGGRRGQQRQPAMAADEAVKEMTLLRDDLKAAIGAAAALAPVIPTDPKMNAPERLTNNENPKKVARIAAIAAIVGEARGAAADAAARAAVAASRVAIAAAYGAPQVGCHRHPRTCAGGPCTLSIHYCLGMFQSLMLVPATALVTPRGMTYDEAWNLYIADAGAHTIVKIDTAGGRTVFAGINTTAGNGGDGLQANATRLSAPRDVLYNPRTRRLYIADTGNSKIREVDMDTGVTTIIAGTGTAGYTNGAPATTKRLDTPSGLALDLEDNLLIADTGNHRIRKLDLTTGTLSDFLGDGFTATLDSPLSVTVDELTGDVYVADTGNRRIRRRNDTDGVVTTLAGAPGGAANTGDAGNASAARFDTISYIKADSTGYLYLADSGKHRIRRIRIGVPTPTITAFCGKTDGSSGNSADGTAIAAIELNAPLGFHVDSGGRNLFISDTGNTRVVRVLT